jgi:hypothetical protein
MTISCSASRGVRSLAPQAPGRSGAIAGSDVAGDLPRGRRGGSLDRGQPPNPKSGSQRE